MAWRPHGYLIGGELDNTVPGKVTGWMAFVEMDGLVQFDLEGDFHRDIRGAKIKLTGKSEAPKGQDYMQDFDSDQTGKVGDITAGLPPRDCVDYPYIEWYSDQNGRVVVELEPDQVEVVGTPTPAIESDPVDRQQQAENMADFINRMSQGRDARV